MSQSIRKAVNEWYGTPCLRMRIMTREQEIEQYEREHSEVPPHLWAFVSHPSRLLFMWIKPEPQMDIIIKRDGQYHMVQDIYFKDSFPEVKDWWNKVREVLEDPKEEVWFAFHE